MLLGAETLRGLYLVETISTVGKICAQVNALDCSYTLKDTTKKSKRRAITSQGVHSIEIWNLICDSISFYFFEL